MKYFLLLLHFSLCISLYIALCTNFQSAYAAEAEEEMYNDKTPMFGVRLRPVNLNTLESVGLAPGQGTMITHV
ncbi:MAG: hypothetical protein HRU15_15710, partial [Planctomycetes bacterium]|nr:hypothetical protein [Planctomycetota bacterium]